MDLILEEECEIALKKSIDDYAQSLKDALGNKLEALRMDELYDIFC